MDTLTFLALAILPPLIAGPVPAALAFRSVSGQDWKRRLPLAILSAIALNLIAGAIIVFSLEGLLPAGFFACSLTPVAAGATLMISLRYFRRAVSGPDGDSTQRRWLRLSLVAIPALQMLTGTMVVLIAPALCSWGVRTCAN